MENLKNFDPQLYDLIKKEEERQIDKIRMIASENYVSQAVLDATGTVLTNKYSEGYPGKRYYEGQQFIDPIEVMAIERAKELFGAEHANVQPYSGSPANLAVYLAFVKPGETVLGMALPHGGHLTHGSPVSITGKYFNIVSYELDKETGLLNYDTIRKLAIEHQPKMIIAGHSAYPRQLDFAKFREIADEVGAILFVDMAHFAGLVAGGAHPNPVPYADVVSTTTHKTLRGPRGGMLLCKEKHAAAIDKAVFPGLQGGPHNHTTAGIAVALKEAMQPEFKAYAENICKNAKTMATELKGYGFNLVTGGTDNHLLLIDLTNKNVTGKQAAKALDKAGLVLNYNSVPYDTRKPFDPSGIRLGLAAVTSRGFGEEEVKKTAAWMNKVIENFENEALLDEIAKEVKDLCRKFPPPGLAY
ncbi:serine hydroxymethyltransferase [Seleniivibrio woodruffii]|uniref:Serine hydroxymethyltransferase n=1 Tax=Seleniivibrio woodruffii TaxID=1078050 RepID=A0A4R1KAQ8_9BACT|nr:serine hydroxymethyltransferase [Seleniivibrio woodruffii]TCK60993.1 glycine hydroxymethyltransferase [Seleniivibrio woodruffii]TVZ36623.1 serine hydroxymethyltransferase [Seleniivibrio woodruffii]